MSYILNKQIGSEIKKSIKLKTNRLIEILMLF